MRHGRSPTGRPSGRTTKRLRQRLWKQQKGRCSLCGGQMRKRGPMSGNRATLDHIIPRSAGGRGGRNLALACYACNQARGSGRTQDPRTPEPVG